MNIYKVPTESNWVNLSTEEKNIKLEKEPMVFNWKIKDNNLKEEDIKQQKNLIIEDIFNKDKMIRFFKKAPPQKDQKEKKKKGIISRLFRKKKKKDKKKKLPKEKDEEILNDLLNHQNKMINNGDLSKNRLPNLQIKDPYTHRGLDIPAYLLRIKTFNSSRVLPKSIVDFKKNKDKTPSDLEVNDSLRYLKERVQKKDVKKKITKVIDMKKLAILKSLELSENDRKEFLDAFNEEHSVYYYNSNFTGEGVLKDFKNIKLIQKFLEDHKLFSEITRCCYNIQFLQFNQSYFFLNIFNELFEKDNPFQINSEKINILFKLLNSVNRYNFLGVEFSQEEFARLKLNQSEKAIILKSFIQKLDTAIYGQETPKLELLTVIQKILDNPQGNNNNILFLGEPGLGKSTLAKLTADFLGAFSMQNAAHGQSAIYYRGLTRQYNQSKQGALADDVLNKGIKINFIIEEFCKIITDTKETGLYSIVLRLLDSTASFKVKTPKLFEGDETIDISCTSLGDEYLPCNVSSSVILTANNINDGRLFTAINNRVFFCFLKSVSLIEKKKLLEDKFDLEIQNVSEAGSEKFFDKTDPYFQLFLSNLSNLSIRTGYSLIEKYCSFLKILYISEKQLDVFNLGKKLYLNKKLIDFFVDFNNVFVPRNLKNGSFLGVLTVISGSSGNNIGDCDFIIMRPKEKSQIDIVCNNIINGREDANFKFSFLIAKESARGWFANNNISFKSEDLDIQLQGGNGSIPMGGSSAGALITLGFILEKARKLGIKVHEKLVAGTGTINPSGKIGKIGGCLLKLISGLKGPFDYIFLPKDNLQSFLTDRFFQEYFYKVDNFYKIREDRYDEFKNFFVNFTQVNKKFNLDISYDNLILSNLFPKNGSDYIDLNINYIDLKEKKIFFVDDLDELVDTIYPGLKKQMQK